MNDLLESVFLFVLFSLCAVIVLVIEKLDERKKRKEQLEREAREEARRIWEDAIKIIGGIYGQAR